jgi:hypothetical protein
MNTKENETFEDFKLNFEKRFNKQSILDLGEDSVRYDFFCALMKIYNLQPYDIQVEYPIHKEAFVPRENKKSKRKENPQIDLYFSNYEGFITAEFGLFKKNGGEKGQINPTEKLFKMLNDMLRLSLNAECLPNKEKLMHNSYFVCVADSTIIGKKMKKKTMRKVFDSFPCEKYEFNHDDIVNWRENSKSAMKIFDDRFVKKAEELKINIIADRLYREKIKNPSASSLKYNNLVTEVIIFKIKTKSTI